MKLTADHARIAEEQGASYWEQEVENYKSNLREEPDADPEDLSSWRHELAIAQRELQKARRRENPTGGKR